MRSETDLSLDELVARERSGDETPVGSIATADDTLVLPWWQHPMNIVTLVVSAAILAAMIGWMVGDSGSSEPHNDVDTGFLQDMRTHHEQAVLMSLVYRNLPETDPGLRSVARSIVIGQNIEVGRMIQLLRQFGEQEANQADTSMAWMGMSAGRDSMPGMASEDELELLGRSEGRAADELFVELMTDHHIGGIEMAEFAMEFAENDEVVAMAAGMAGGQRGEIVEMTSLLDE